MLMDNTVWVRTFGLRRSLNASLIKWGLRKLVLSSLLLLSLLLLHHTCTWRCLTSRLSYSFPPSRAGREPLPACSTTGWTATLCTPWTPSAPCTTCTSRPRNRRSTRPTTGPPCTRSRWPRDSLVIECAFDFELMLDATPCETDLKIKEIQRNSLGQYNKPAACVSCLPTAAHLKTSSWRLATARSTASSAAAARPSPRSSWRRWRRPSRRRTTRTWWCGSGWPCAPTCQRPECRYGAERLKNTAAVEIN